MRKIFEKFKKFSRNINKILGSLEQISEKFVGNIWLIFLQFEKFSSIQVFTYYNLVEIFFKFCKAIWKGFVEIKKKIEKMLIKSFENFQDILWKFKN